MYTFHNTLDVKGLGSIVTNVNSRNKIGHGFACLKNTKHNLNLVQDDKYLQKNWNCLFRMKFW